MTKYRNAGAELAACLANSPDTNIALQSISDRTAPAPISRTLVLPLPPSGNRYWRHYQGRVVVSADARAYKIGVQLQAQQHNVSPATGPVAVYVHVYRARKAGDLDNMQKVLLDALCGVAYQDDAQIVELHAWRHDDKANPRVEVEVRILAR